MNQEQFLANGGLDFTVSKRKIWYNDPVIDDFHSTSFYCTVNDTTSEALGPVRSAYTVKQNSELLKIVLDKMGQGNYNLEESKCGSFDHGRKVYFFIKYVTQSAWPGEQSENFVYALSSHDGSQRLVFGVCSQIHSCSNMFGVLMNDKEKSHVIKHTKRIENIDANGSLQRLVNDNLAGVASLMRKMHESNHIPTERFISDVKDLIANSQSSRLTQSYHQKRETLDTCVSNEMRDKGHSYYGLFNGITNYLTHQTGREDAFTYNLAGKGSKISVKAVQMIVEDMKMHGCLN